MSQVMRENEPVLLVLSTYDGKLFLRKGKFYLRNVNVSSPSQKFVLRPCYDSRTTNSQTLRPTAFAILSSPALLKNTCALRAVPLGRDDTKILPLSLCRPASWDTNHFSPCLKQL